MTQQQQECPIDRNALHVDISVLCHRFPGGSDDSRQLQLPSKKKKKSSNPFQTFCKVLMCPQMQRTNNLLSEQLKQAVSTRQNLNYYMLLLRLRKQKKGVYDYGLELVVREGVIVALQHQLLMENICFLSHPHETGTWEMSPDGISLNWVSPLFGILMQYLNTLGNH